MTISGIEADLLDSQDHSQMDIEGFEDFDERITLFQHDPYIKQALAKGITLRQVAGNVERDLELLEHEIIDEC